MESLTYQQVLADTYEENATDMFVYENEDDKDVPAIDNHPEELENQEDFKKFQPRLGSEVLKPNLYNDLSTTNILYHKCIKTNVLSIDSRFRFDEHQINIDSIKIEDQIWVTKNLNVASFRNGDSIPEAKSAEEWKKAGDLKRPAWCYYDNNPTNGNKYGKLYNWFAITDKRGLVPSGWHVPTDAEWSKLTDFLNDDDDAGVMLKSCKGWEAQGNGDNTLGFTGLPGGYRDKDGSFLKIGYSGYWWSSSEDGTSLAWCHCLNFSSTDMLGSINEKQDGFSVRCLKN